MTYLSRHLGEEEGNIWLSGGENASEKTKAVGVGFENQAAVLGVGGCVCLRERVSVSMRDWG